MSDDRRSTRTRRKKEDPTTRVRGFLSQLRGKGVLEDHPDVEGVLDAVVLSGESDAMMDFWFWLQPQGLSAGPKVVVCRFSRNGRASAPR